MDCPNIYILTINEIPVYVGKTGYPKNRYKQHKSDCYNENRRAYDKYTYMTIRQLGISRDQFQKYIKLTLLYEDVPLEYQSIMEDLVMNLYSEYGYNIFNTYQGLDYSICEHNKQRFTCKECGGSAICEHNKQQSYCKECGGNGICHHNRRRSSCKECGGSSICWKSLVGTCGSMRFVPTHPIL